MARFDAIVIGVGGMGSAACHHLARRGMRVLGLEQFTPAHDRGSSHGRTRICRKAYFEHPDYVPLLHRAYTLWAELEAATGRRLFERCGLVVAGPERSTIVQGIRRAAAEHALDIAELDAAQAERRFPALRFPADLHVLHERDAGMLFVEDCVQAQIDEARRHGADLRFGERVVAWESDGGVIRVRTECDEHQSASLAITAGAWAKHLLDESITNSAGLQVQRRMQVWLGTDNPDLRPGACPVYAYHVDDGFYYGFPAVDSGMVKLAEHFHASPAEPDALDRTLPEGDARRLRTFARKYLRGVKDEIVRHAACMYTMTPDEHFLIDRHPRYANVVIAAGFSGHGFKFAPLVGEIVADLLLDGRTGAPIGFLSLARFPR